MKHVYIMHAISNAREQNIVEKKSEIPKDDKLPSDEDKLRKGEETETLRVPKYQPRIVYPAKVSKDQQDEQFKKFSDMFNHVKVPFVEALAQMLRYAKFFKELPTNKKKLEEVSTTTLSEECLFVLTNKLPKKEKDP